MLLVACCTQCQIPFGQAIDTEKCATGDNCADCLDENAAQHCHRKKNGMVNVCQSCAGRNDRKRVVVTSAQPCASAVSEMFHQTGDLQPDDTVGPF